ncbi:acyloxyacyl hydrolase [Comamonas nitrativorans]|uniref:Lipid A deacylase n=1 Tax=Comamonas nitrativorans TaxID=108437 RepID=A0ABV9GW59_9BURK
MHKKHYLLALALCTACPWSFAQNPPDRDSRSLYLQAGVANHSAHSTTVGVTLPWNGSYALGSGAVTGQWDVSLGYVSARPQNQGRRGLTALGGGINLRWRARQGASPWFVEAGTGVVLHSRHYASDDKYFSTRYNFSSHLGIGRNFGPQGRHALALRVQHVSNAGLKKPNPGDNFLLVRYSVGF